MTSGACPKPSDDGKSAALLVQTGVSPRLRSVWRMPGLRPNATANPPSWLYRARLTPFQSCPTPDHLHPT